MRFANPQMLWLLPVTVPLLVWFLCWAWRRKQALIAQFVQSRLLPQLMVGLSRTVQKVRMTLLVLTVTFVLLALARPQWGFDWEEARQGGLDIVVAIDTSRSMLAEDVRPNRLARARLAALDLMKLAKNDRLALAPFAGTAFLQCPLTLDDQAFRQSVEALEVGIIPQGGTALTEAIETALTAYKEGGQNFKVLVLFTDGEDHDSGALEAARKAAASGLKIFTVGVGTPNGELLRVTDENGVSSYIKDDQGNVVKSRLDESLLREIATATGGVYLPLRGADAMETLYEKWLAPLPKTENASRLVQHYHERFQWPLAFAIAALLVESLLPDRRRAPGAATAFGAALNRESGKTVAALVLLLAVPLGATGSPANARRLYEDGKFKQAQQEYERLLDKGGEVKWSALEEALLKHGDSKDEGAREELLRSLQKANLGDPRLHFNAGSAAFKAGDLKSAQSHFGLALTAPDLKLQERAFYNLGNTFYRSGEQTQAVEQKIAQGEKAVDSYQGAVGLDPQDADAKFNLDYVKTKLEELKQQQAKQEQKPKDQKQDKKQDQKQEQQKNEQKQSPDSSQQPGQQDQKQDPSRPDSKPKDQPAQDQAQQQQQKADQQKDKDQAKQDKPPQNAKAGNKDDDKSAEPSEADAQSAPGQMTVLQAQQLLDSHKGEERAMIFVPTQKLKEPRRVFKDW